MGTITQLGVGPVRSKVTNYCAALLNTVASLILALLVPTFVFLVSRRSHRARAWTDRSRGWHARKLLLSAARDILPCLFLVFLSVTPVLKTMA